MVQILVAKYSDQSSDQEFKKMCKHLKYFVF